MKIRLSILLFAAVAALTGCNRKSVQPRFETWVVDTLVSGPSSDCRVAYRFATIRNAGDSPALEAIERANIGYFFELEEFEGTAREAVDTVLEEIRNDFLRELPAQHSFEVSAEAEGGIVDTLVSYVISRSSYLGGAHGMYSVECHTYSLAEGFELSAADFFTEPQLHALNASIRAKICEEYAADDDEGLSAAGFFPDEIAVTENFRITPEGITFFYNPYDIGCYALGGVEVFFSREELEELRR